MTDAKMVSEARSARRRKVAVTATALAEHLGVSRQYVARLADEGTIVRQDDGLLDQDAARLAYLNWLRDPARRVMKGEAEQAFLREKTKALEIRNAQRLGELFPTAVANEIIDGFVDGCMAEMQNMAFRIAGSDLALRRRIERVVHEARHSISNRLADKARQALPQGPGEAAKETADDDA